jgi:hypothetical protein
MRIKLTKRMVEAIAVGEADVLVWDDTLRGFGVKVTPKGARVYVLQYSFGGRSRRVTIGRHGELTAEEARRKALGLRAAVAGLMGPIRPACGRPIAPFRCSRSSPSATSASTQR